MWDILYSRKHFKVSNKSCLNNLFFQSTLFLKYGWIFTNSLGQYFDKLSLNADSCQTANSTDYFKNLNEHSIQQMYQICRHCVHFKRFFTRYNHPLCINEKPTFSDLLTLASMFSGSSSVRIMFISCTEAPISVSQIIPKYSISCCCCIVVFSCIGMIFNYRM